MQKLMAQLNAWISKRMFFVVLTGLLIGFTLPISNLDFYGNFAILLFAYMTFITALDTNLKDFLQVLSKPKIVIWMLVLIHLIMPLVALGIGFTFYPTDHWTRLGFLLGASIPIGVTSVIWTSIAKGDIALSLTAVTLDTLITPFVLPLFISLFVGKYINFNFTQVMAGLLLMVTIPSILGMIVNQVSQGRLTDFSHSVGGFTSKIALLFVIYINASAIAPSINWDTSMFKLLSVIFLLVVTGYSLGFIGSLTIKPPQRSLVATMVYNVGMRNISFGAVLAVAYFPPAVAIPVTLGMLYQQPVAAVISHLFNRFDQTRNPTTATGECK